MHLVKQIHGGSFVAIDIKTNVEPLSRRDFAIMKRCWELLVVEPHLETEEVVSWLLKSDNPWKWKWKQSEEYLRAKSYLKNPFALQVLKLCENVQDCLSQSLEERYSEAFSDYMNLKMFEDATYEVMKEMGKQEIVCGRCNSKFCIEENILEAKKVQCPLCGFSARDVAESMEKKSKVVLKG